MVNLELSLNGRTIGKLELDEALLKQLVGAVAPMAPAPAPAAEPPSLARSAALTTSQAIELLEKLDKASRQFLVRFTEEHGALTWGETKVLFNLKDWDDFVGGPEKKIDKIVQRLTGDKSARLIWRVEHEWIGLEKGRDEACRLHIDGPALEALRAAAGTT